MAPVSQGEATSMARHVRMSFEAEDLRQPQPFRSSGQIPLWRRMVRHALQHRNRDQEILAPGSQISSKGRLADLGDVENACPLLLLMDTVSDE
jgi:hypothetical protein